VIFEVQISRSAQKSLRKLPRYVVQLLDIWVSEVGERGLESVRKLPGYHDEALKGDRKGQRSIRLTKAYRAIYKVTGDEVEFVLIQEVNKHEY
jgi:toxin HigB-1